MTYTMYMMHHSLSSTEHALVSPLSSQAITLTYTSFSKDVTICSPAVTITLTIPGEWFGLGSLSVFMHRDAFCRHWAKGFSNLRPIVHQSKCVKPGQLQVSSLSRLGQESVGHTIPCCS